jgi:UDP-glucose 4-epimerase
VRILISGIAGFLGHAIAERALAASHSVAGVDLQLPRAALRSQLASFTQGTVTGASVAELIARFEPELCIHCAGRSSVPQSVADPRGDFEASALPTMALLDELRRSAPRCRFVLLSSAAVYGSPELLPIAETQPCRPVSPYGFHKLICEQLCREYHQLYALPTVSVRIFSAYGEGLRRQVIWDVLEKTVKPGPLLLQGSSVASRDFVHATDVAAGILLVAARGELDGGSYNLASGIETPIGELAARLARAVGVDDRVQFDGAIAPGVPVRWKADIGKLGALGFAPSVSLERGISALVDWWRANRG